MFKYCYNSTLNLFEITSNLLNIILITLNRNLSDRDLNLFKSVRSLDSKSAISQKSNKV